MIIVFLMFNWGTQVIWPQGRRVGKTYQGKMVGTLVISHLEQQFSVSWQDLDSRNFLKFFS